MNARDKPVVEVPPDKTSRDHKARVGNQPESLSDAMRRITDEARVEISRAIKRESEKESH